MNTIQLKFHFERETNQQTARDVLNIMTDYEHFEYIRFV